MYKMVQALRGRDLRQTCRRTAVEMAGQANPPPLLAWYGREGKRVGVGSVGTRAQYT